MKSKLSILLLTLISVFSFKAQDTNIIYHDIVPDYVITAYLDTFKVDINDDGLNDVSFYMFQ